MLMLNVPILRKIYLLSFFIIAFFITSISFAGDAAAGKERSMLCSGCHGATGISVSPDIPNLAKQKEAYLMKAMKDFRSGNRKNPMMSSIAQGLSDEDIANLAAFFTSL